MDLDATTLLIVALAALLGAGFTVVPVVPGTLAIPLGAVLIGFESGWEQFSPWFWTAQAVLVVAYLLVDNVAQVFGVRRVGGSRAAMVGGAIGVVVGPLVLAFAVGPFALLLGPPVGAIAGTLLGEHHARSKAGSTPLDRRDSVRLGTGALIAWALSTAIKLVLIAIQVGFLLFAVR